MIDIIQNAFAHTKYSNGPFEYFRVAVDDSYTVDPNFDSTIMVFDGSFMLYSLALNPGDSLQVKKRNDICLRGTGTLLIARVPVVDGDKENFSNITRDGAHYKVSKPWGYELWVNGEHPKYCMKKILIKQGNQTSLQYHNFKEESNLIVVGEAILVKKRDDSLTPIDNVTDADLEEIKLTGPFCIYVTPKTLHRLVALTDLILIEVSTPYLDDVIRIQDDAQRANGRIASEHK